MKSPDITEADRAPRTPATRAGEVLQVERHDYVDLAPTDRKRVQSMQGFDPIYTDIVDYIVRCTHRIWDERDVGLIYTHYTHNCVVYLPTRTIYDREEVVRDTIARLATLPERRGMATQVIWSGDDREGFYTSHLVTGSGRHSQHGSYGPPTGRTFVSRTIADCMIFENRIYREWIVADIMAIVRQLGLDPHSLAAQMARAAFEKGLTCLKITSDEPTISLPPRKTIPVSAKVRRGLLPRFRHCQGHTSTSSLQTAQLRLTTHPASVDKDN